MERRPAGPSPGQPQRKDEQPAEGPHVPQALRPMHVAHRQVEGGHSRNSQQGAVVQVLLSGEGHQKRRSESLQVQRQEQTPADDQKAQAAGVQGAQQYEQVGNRPTRGPVTDGLEPDEVGRVGGDQDSDQHHHGQEH